MSIEVMKQALEVIVTGKGKFEAITALRQAIEQAEKQEPVGYIDSIGNFQNTRLDDRDTPVYTNPPTAPAQQPLNDFDMRGVLASRLLCWHRLTEAEAQDLICFFEGVRRPAPAQQPLTEQAWECNECGSQEYTSILSEHEVHELGCGKCGSSEWHLADIKGASL